MSNTSALIPSAIPYALAKQLDHLYSALILCSDILQRGDAYGLRVGISSNVEEMFLFRHGDFAQHIIDGCVTISPDKPSVNELGIDIETSLPEAMDRQLEILYLALLKCPQLLSQGRSYGLAIGLSEEILCFIRNKHGMRSTVMISNCRVIPSASQRRYAEPRGPSTGINRVSVFRRLMQRTFDYA